MMKGRRLGEQGFSLIELLTVIGITTILITIAGMYFNRMQVKANIEKEVSTIYTTLMAVRLEALYGKTGRAVTFSGKQMKIYPSADITTTPVSTIPLAYPVVMTVGADRVEFNSSGMMTDTDRSICVDPTGALGDNVGNTDSVAVLVAKTYMGKRESGGACAPATVQQK